MRACAQRPAETRAAGIGHRLSGLRGRERSVHLPVRLRSAVLPKGKANRANSEGHVKR